MVIALERAADFPLLIIDDEQAVLDLMHDVFCNMPVQISATPDPQKGLELLKRLQPRLVFLDLNMPNLHGMDLLEQILQIDPRTEVILITGDYSPSSAVEAI